MDILYIHIYVWSVRVRLYKSAERRDSPREAQNPAVDPPPENEEQEFERSTVPGHGATVPVPSVRDGIGVVHTLKAAQAVSRRLGLPHVGSVPNLRGPH